MIIEIRNKTKNAKEIICKCDNCYNFFLKRYLKEFLNKPHLFCSKFCSDIQKQTGGHISKQYIETCLNKYGVSNIFQDENIKNIIKQNIMINYGVNNISQNNDIKLLKKKTCLNNFGYNTPLQSPEIMKKCINTCLLKYGVKNPSQVPAFFNKAQSNMRGSNKTGIIKINNNNVYFRSSYEEKFLLIVNNNIDELKCNIPIKYNYLNKIKTYYADFLLTLNNKNILFEIKPKSLINTQQNIAKFKAARNFIKNNNIHSFIILTEEELFNSEFNIKNYF